LIEWFLKHLLNNIFFKLANSKDISSRQSENNGWSVANTVSKAAISLPAVPAMEQKDEVKETAEPLQLKTISGADAVNPPANPDPNPAVQKKRTGNIVNTAAPFSNNKFYGNKLSGNNADNISFQLQVNNPQNTVAASGDTGSFKPIQKKENNTGIPDNLKSGIENISGFSMDDVQVHYNSDKPAQLQAHAYAQGTDIHIAPGQEQHLPHEAWHVVQQKQGRVIPTKQMKGKVKVNDDTGLENEADVMGDKAMNMDSDPIRGQLKFESPGTMQPVQRVAVKINSKIFKQHHVYEGGSKAAVGTLVKGSIIEVDLDERNFINSKMMVKVLSGETNITFNKKKGNLFDINDLWVSMTSYTISEVEERVEAGEDLTEEPEEEASEEEGEEEEGPEADLDVLGQEFNISEGGLTTEIGGAEFNLSKDGVTISLFGQELKIGKDSAELTGEFSKDIKINPLDGIGFNLDIPIPAPVPIYGTVGIEPILEMALKVAGSYSAKKESGKKTFDINGEVGGSASLGVTVKAGLGIGAANIVGVNGGIFGSASAEFAATGKLAGNITNENSKPWSSSSMSMKLNASADLVGKVGAYIEANIIGYRKTKKFDLLEKKFGIFDYKRESEVNKTGVSARDFIPTFADFKGLVCPKQALTDDNEWDDSETQPLLGGSGNRS
jgi:hypothetical protein